MFLSIVFSVLHLAADPSIFRPKCPGVDNCTAEDRRPSQPEQAAAPLGTTGKHRPQSRLETFAAHFVEVYHVVQTEWFLIDFFVFLDAPPPTWEQLEKGLVAVKTVVHGLVDFIQNHSKKGADPQQVSVLVFCTAKSIQKLSDGF